LAKAIQSVDGAKLLIPPKPGTGAHAQTIAVVELGGKANLAAVTAAVEGAKTPHSAQSAPDVVTVVAGKLKPGATSESIMEALKKANMVEE